MQRKARLEQLEGLGPVVADADLRGRAELEVFASAPGAGAREAVIEPFGVHVGLGQPRAIVRRWSTIGSMLY
jgi:hypothetical protein